MGRGKVPLPFVSPSKAMGREPVRGMAPTHTVNHAGYETSRQRRCPYFSDNKYKTQWKVLLQLSK